MTQFVLIVFMWHDLVAMQSFNTQAACEQAREFVKQDRSQNRTICIKDERKVEPPNAK